MDRSIGAISATPSISPTAAAWKQRRQDYVNLISSLQSADIESAKAAFAKLTAKQAPPANSPLAAVGAALQTGDTAAVQKAATALQQARNGQNHPPHEADASKAPPPATTRAKAGSIINILA